MTTWQCACGAQNDVRMKICDFCGEERRREESTPKAPPPAYRVFPERKFSRSTPDERCPECGKTVREHIAEFKRAGAAIAERLTETR